MSTAKQELQALKEANLKLQENLKKFLKQDHEESKNFIFIQKNKAQEFLEEQDSLLESFNQRIDDITTNIIDDLLVSSLHTSGQNTVNKQLTSHQTESHSPPSKIPRMESNPVISKSHLESFINIPGLRHLAENIFLNLKKEKLEDCRFINEAAKKFLDDATFWLKKFIKRGLSKDNQTKWMEAIQLAKNTNFEESIVLYLKESSKHERLVDLQCYIDEDIIEKSSYFIKIFGQYKAYENLKILALKVQDFVPGCIQTLAPIAKCQGKIDIFTEKVIKGLGHAAGLGNTNSERGRGHFKVISALVPLADNFNDLVYHLNPTFLGLINIARFPGGQVTLIQAATMAGQLETIKYFVSFTGNPNRSLMGEYYTPIKLATRLGYENIATFLQQRLGT